MANTRKLSRKQRKTAKRNARRELSKLREGLTQQQRVEWRKSGKGIRAFLAEAKKTAE